MTTACSGRQSLQVVFNQPAVTRLTSLMQKALPFLQEWKKRAASKTPCHYHRSNTRQTRAGRWFAPGALCPGSAGAQCGKSSDTGTGGACLNPLNLSTNKHMQLQQRGKAVLTEIDGKEVLIEIDGKDVLTETESEYCTYISAMIFLGGNKK